MQFLDIYLILTLEKKRLSIILKTIYFRPDFFYKSIKIAINRLINNVFLALEFREKLLRIQEPVLCIFSPKSSNHSLFFGL